MVLLDLPFPFVLFFEDGVPLVLEPVAVPPLLPSSEPPVFCLGGDFFPWGAPFTFGPPFSFDGGLLLLFFFPLPFFFPSPASLSSNADFTSLLNHYFNNLGVNSARF